MRFGATGLTAPSPVCRSHFSRKCYTNVKTDLVAAGVDKIILSQMDMAFMFTYAGGSFIAGRLGDMFPQNIIIAGGLIGSTVCLGLIQYFEWLGVVHYNYQLGFFLFVTAQFIHGLMQATGGPVNTSVMGTTADDLHRKLGFGCLLMCVLVGVACVLARSPQATGSQRRTAA